MSDKSKTIIVKKVRKGHEGGHGGSWKVAYADFVTAMMAFFLLMWLLAMVSPEKRAAVSEYFKHFSIFQSSGKSFMKESSQIFTHPGNEAKTLTKEFGQGQGEISAEEFRNRLNKAIDEKLQGLKEHLMVDTVEGGVRIQLVDTEGKPMFRPGGADPTQFAKEILSFVADNIKGIPNKIAVEGHTDASPLKSEKYTNWELSTERASAARRSLEDNGIDSNRIARVVGYADTELLYKDNPTDSRNRRISIILLEEKVKEPPKPVPVERIETKPEAPQPVKAVPPAAVKPSPKKAPETPAKTRREQNKSLIEPIVPVNPIELNKPVIAN
ncbi:MAG TPA: flagellar motor protein MotB [Dissulfurispiraceae bacterium]|nr:flagellar motor protein MotB [Dissulfurispiraceae bacterium]